LLEERRVAQRTKQLAGEHGQKINRAFETVFKPYTERIRPDDLESGNLVNRMVHASPLKARIKAASEEVFLAILMRTLFVGMAL
jgi:hypothetical protein